eukprot:6990-Heterococcus_DN1.PRE.5
MDASLNPYYRTTQVREKGRGEPRHAQAVRTNQFTLITTTTYCTVLTTLALCAAYRSTCDSDQPHHCDVCCCTVLTASLSMLICFCSSQACAWKHWAELANNWLDAEEVSVTIHAVYNILRYRSLMLSSKLYLFNTRDSKYLCCATAISSNAMQYTLRSAAVLTHQLALTRCHTVITTRL